MGLNLEQIVTAAAEVKNFDTDLNFSNEQRQILQEFPRLALEQIEEYKVANPQSSEPALSRTIAKTRNIVRKRMAHFLNGEQIKEWITKFTNAQRFLGITVEH